MSTSQLDTVNNDAAEISIRASDVADMLVEDVGQPDTSKKLARLLFSLGFFTLVMDVGTALYKPPRGVVFARHNLAYYLTLAAIFAAGVVQVWTGIWLSSSSGQDDGRRRKLARAVLGMSVVPLVVVVALGGFTVLRNY
ncbi:hypothetical protein ACP70R_030447 [Stipagrostis hirtigluma subsp. patula]